MRGVCVYYGVGVYSLNHRESFTPLFRKTRGFVSEPFFSSSNSASLLPASLPPGTGREGSEAEGGKKRNSGVSGGRGSAVCLCRELLSAARHASRAMPMQQPEHADKMVLKRIIGTKSESKTTLSPLHRPAYAPPAWHAMRHTRMRVSVVSRRTSPCGGLVFAYDP